MNFIIASETVPRPIIIFVRSIATRTEDSSKIQVNHVSSTGQTAIDSSDVANAEEQKLPTNSKQSSPSPPSVAGSTDLKAGEDSKRIQAGEVASKPTNYCGKRDEKSIQNRRIGQKRKGTTHSTDVKTVGDSKRIQDGEVASKPTHYCGKRVEKAIQNRRLGQKRKVTTHSTDLKMAEDSKKIQAKAVAIKPAYSRGKRVEKPSQNRRLGQKRKVTTKKGEHHLKSKKSNPVPIAQMAMEAMKGLKKRNGATVEDILAYMEGQHKVNAKTVKRYVTRYLTSAVRNSTVGQLIGAGGQARFKIKKAENAATVGKKSRSVQKVVKTVKK